MTPFLQLSLALAIIITAAKAAGYLSYRLGQPSVLGELLVGVLLGPSLLNILHVPYFTDEHLPQVIHEMAEMGVLLLMFIAGLDLHLADLAKTGKVAALAGVLGVAFPFALSLGLGFMFSMGPTVSIFLGLILSATSVSISAQTLIELKALRSRVGISLLGAAVFDDILVVLGLSIFTALALSESGNGFGSVLQIALRMLLFLGIALGVGMLFLPRLSKRISSLPISQGLIAFTVVMVLLYGWAAEVFGQMAAITGAFLAGLIFAQSPVRERIESGVSALAYGLFVPVFFINVGLTADVQQISGGIFWLFLAMTLVAIIGKVGGAGLGARLGGFSWREARQLGIGMMSRGEVGLIVATVGVSQGLVSRGVFSAVIGMVIVTTLLTPPLLRASFHKADAAAGPKPAQKQADASTTAEGEEG